MVVHGEWDEISPDRDFLMVDNPLAPGVRSPQIEMCCFPAWWIITRLLRWDQLTSRWFPRDWILVILSRKHLIDIAPVWDDFLDHLSWRSSQKNLDDICEQRSLAGWFYDRYITSQKPGWFLWTKIVVSSHIIFNDPCEHTPFVWCSLFWVSSRLIFYVFMLRQHCEQTRHFFRSGEFAWTTNMDFFFVFCLHVYAGAEREGSEYKNDRWNEGCLQIARIWMSAKQNDEAANWVVSIYDTHLCSGMNELYFLSLSAFQLEYEESSQVSTLVKQCVWIEKGVCFEKFVGQRESSCVHFLCAFYVVAKPCWCGISSRNLVSECIFKTGINSRNYTTPCN